MNLIKELCEKYNGNYFEKEKKSSVTPIGKIGTQFIQAKISFDGHLFEIEVEKEEGIFMTGKPIQIKRGIRNEDNQEFSMYPKAWIDYFFDIFSNKKASKFLSKRQIKFQVLGNRKIHDHIFDDQNLYTLLKDEKICIYLKPIWKNTIILTPVRGIKNLEHLEKLMKILNIVSNKIDTVPNIG